jgi:hypothetical protein
MRAWTRSISAISALGLIAAASPGYVDAGAQDAGAQVIVRAAARDGQPVLDLKPGDVTVRIDGDEREVKSLELVRPSEGAPAPAAATPPPSTLPPPYATNTAAAPGPKGAREILLVIDDEGIGIGREQMVRDAITRLISALTPSDRVGILAMKQGGVSIAPTAQHAMVSEALPKIMATGSPSETAINLACRTKVMLGTLGGLFRGAPPERTIVFFSPGMSPPITTDQMRSRSDNADSNLCQIRTNDLEELGKAAAGSPAELFVVYHGEGMTNPDNLSSAQAGLENVAGTSGAEMLRLTGSGETVAERVARTAGFYYVASLEGAASGPVRRVEARVNRDGVRVTARPLTAPAAAAAAKAASPRDMLRVATVYHDLPIRAAGFVSRQAGANDLKVVALFEPEDPTVKLTAAMIGLVDEKETLKAQWTAQPNELGRAPVIAALTAAPGKYRMRVAVTDSTGKGGTADYELPVRLPDATPLKTSDMLLGVGQGGFAPRLAFSAADAAAIGFIEIYGVQKDTKLEVTFEIVNGTEVMGSGQGTVGPGPGDDARIAYGGFGIATLAPGDYTMRATINVDGKQAGVATRTLRKLK